MASILIAFTGFWLLPNWPGKKGTLYFSPEEQEMASYRASVSAGGASEDDEGSYWGGVALACKEPYTWMFALMHFAIVIAQSFKDFLPSVSGLTYCTVPTSC